MGKLLHSISVSLLLSVETYHKFKASVLSRRQHSDAQQACSSKDEASPVTIVLEDADPAACVQGRLVLAHALGGDRTLVFALRRRRRRVRLSVLGLLRVGFMGILRIGFTGLLRVGFTFFCVFYIAIFTIEFVTILTFVARAVALLFRRGGRSLWFVVARISEKRFERAFFHDLRTRPIPSLEKKYTHLAPKPSDSMLAVFVYTHRVGRGGKRLDSDFRTVFNHLWMDTTERGRTKMF